MPEHSRTSRSPSMDNISRLTRYKHFSVFSSLSRIESIELNFFLLSLNIYFCSFLYFLKKSSLMYFLSHFCASQQKKMSDCDTFGPGNLGNVSQKRDFVIKKCSHMWPESLTSVIALSPFTMNFFLSGWFKGRIFLCSLIRRKIWNIVKAIAVSEMFV